MQHDELREQLARALTWNSAHTSLSEVLHAIPPEYRGYAHTGVPYSVWQLVEHIRISLHDIVTFTAAEGYKKIRWPDDYWPDAQAAPSEEAWDEAVADIEQNLKQLQTIILDGNTGLTNAIPDGEGQTPLRELLLSVDHNAYHLGQLVILLRLAGAWPAR